MMYLLLSVLVALVAISIIPTVFSESISGDFTIPDWVKNTAGWWAEGKIHDITFVGAIKYLISQGIMTVEQEQEAESLPPCPHKIISGYTCIVEEVVEGIDFYMELNG